MAGNLNSGIIYLITTVQFMFSKKATKIDEIFTDDLPLFS